jgi:hypothetical protein
MPAVEHLRFHHMQYYTPMKCHFQVLRDSKFQFQKEFLGKVQNARHAICGYGCRVTGL